LIPRFPRRGRLSRKGEFMTDRNAPSSDFLKAVVADDLPLSIDGDGAVNLDRLIALTRDSDRSNRDWATFLLASEDVDNAAVRQALIDAASDEDSTIRAEAIFGLTRRDRDLALPLVRQALADNIVAFPIFEAAALLADASLVEGLRGFTGPSDEPYLDQCASGALAACESGVPLAFGLEPIAGTSSQS
jgi:hypothetical protein